MWVPGACPPDAASAEAKADSHRPCKTVPCLLLTVESARYLLIYFHSNAEDLGRCRWFCQFLRDQFQVHVLAVEYPGYGVCPGSVSREGVLANAEAALQFAMDALRLPLEQIKVFGRSIGTAPALALAARSQLAGLILVTPFLSVRQLFHDRIGPLSNLVEEWFENDVAMERVQSPTMFVHGRDDKIVSFHHSEELYRKCNVRKLLVTPVGLDHNTNLTADAAFLVIPMFRFFSLPDYCFAELEVPPWVFDKRRSPLYARPEAQGVAHGGRCGPSGASPAGSERISLPRGDSVEPIDSRAPHSPEAPPDASDGIKKKGCLPAPAAQRPQASRYGYFKGGLEPRPAQDALAPKSSGSAAAKVRRTTARPILPMRGISEGDGLTRDIRRSPLSGRFSATHGIRRGVHNSSVRSLSENLGRRRGGPGGPAAGSSLDLRPDQARRSEARSCSLHGHGGLADASSLEPLPDQEPGIAPTAPQMMLKGASVGNRRNAFLDRSWCNSMSIGRPVKPLDGDSIAMPEDDLEDAVPASPPQGPQASSAVAPSAACQLALKSTAARDGAASKAQVPKLLGLLPDEDKISSLIGLFDVAADVPLEGSCSIPLWVPSCRATCRPSRPR